MWVRLFLQIAAIFLVFVAVLTVCNSSLMTEYYVYREKADMRETAVKIDEVKLYGSEASNELSDIISKKGYSLYILDSFGNTLYSSYDAPVANYKGEFQPNAGAYGIDGSEGFSQFNRGKDTYLRYNFRLSGGELLSLTIRRGILVNSAEIANRFILIVAVCCLALTLIWVLFFARKIAEPIRQMNDITRDMASLDFTRKLTPSSNDEIGQLAVSINTLSNELSSTLNDLEKKNAVLQNEIDAERRLDKMRRGFVANVSHELKTPISIISGYAEGLKLNIGKAKDRKEYADIIISETSRMNSLVLSLLELSKLEAKESAITPKKYNLSEQIAEVCTKFSTVENIDIELKTGENIEVFADPDKIEGVLKNYISNAISHKFQNGVIKLWTDLADGRVKVSVFNSGQHIPHEDLENIWQSFWRGNSAHKRETNRFGLGLSIVKATIENHGTACGVYNAEGGVVFWFSLNLAAK